MESCWTEQCNREHVISSFLQYHSNGWGQALEVVECLWVKVLLDKLHRREKGKDAGEVDEGVTVKRSHRTQLGLNGTEPGRGRLRGIEVMTRWKAVFLEVVCLQQPMGAC